MMNLDFACMETAQAMAAIQGLKSDKENLATKALGVLLENGPYGMLLYLAAQKGSVAAGYQRELLNVLSKGGFEGLLPSPPTNGTQDSIRQWLGTVAQDLDAYLFVKRLWQQTLTYARYHAKAADETGSAS